MRAIADVTLFNCGKAKPGEKCGVGFAVGETHVPGPSKPNPPLRAPPARRLRVYAFDPHASLDLGSAKYSHATISLAWDDPADGTIEPGPINEYLEVIDVDPCSNQFYEPIDLNAPEVLAQDGLPPSEGDPRFHQQMVFAVVMKTIKLFERALGRKMMWRPQWDETRKTYVDTPRLRVYPHALREANAYYSPAKRALLFGYFTATQRSAGASWIFTALSHDIIVHETTHAILDGLHPRYSERTSVDSMAFHEAFADIAALFSHFQLYEAVYDFIANSGGRLDQSGLLSGLAGQFAKGTTGRATLRNYIEAAIPEAEKADRLEQATEAHDRGAILVAAVFDAFLSIYTARTEDLLRMSGVRLGSSQHLHPDLVARLTKEATKSADHVLRMCIRALDYLPPVDVRFGEFLRAIVTADNDLVPDDRLNYRLAFVEAFRRRGIFPDHCLSMSPDNLLWDYPEVKNPEHLSTADILDIGLDLTPKYRRSELVTSVEANRRKVWYWLTQPYVTVKGDPNSEESARLYEVLRRARHVFATETDEPYAPDAAALDAAAKVAAAPTAAELKQAAAEVTAACVQTLSVTDAKAARDASRAAETAMRRVNALAGRLPQDVKAETSIADTLEAARKDAGQAVGWPAVLAFLDDASRELRDAGYGDSGIAALRNDLAGEPTHIGQWDKFLAHIPTYRDIRLEPEVDQTWEAALGIFFQRPETRAVAPGAAPHRPLNSISGSGLNSASGEVGLKVEVHSVRTTRRAGPDGQEIRQLVIEVAQRRQGYANPQEQADVDSGKAPWRYGDFVFRGGATLIIDLRDARLRYVISKRIDDDGRLEAQRRFLMSPSTLGFTYDRGGGNEPFALLHRH